MKRSQAFPGNYLGKDDVHAPIQAIIEDVARRPVQCEHGMEDKPVMSFTADQLKPLIMNNVNWLICEDAYGEDSDDWRGRAVEIYVDPNVMFGQKRVGGLRLRIPTPSPAGPGPRSGAVAPPAAAPIQPPAPVQPPAPRPAPIQEPPQNLDEHAKALAGLNGAGTVENLEQWARWAKQFSFPTQLQDQLEDAYHMKKERLTARRPARATA